MKATPLLPEETLRRVLRLAQIAGICVLAVPGFFALASASLGDVTGVIVGLLVAAAGAVELHGADLLRAGEPRGTSWLVSSQIYLMIVIIAFCGWQLTHMNLTLWRMALTSDVKASIAQTGLTEEQFLATTYRFGYRLIALITFFYQGGMALYYFRRRGAVLQALEAEL